MIVNAPIKGIKRSAASHPRRVEVPPGHTSGVGDAFKTKTTTSPRITDYCASRRERHCNNIETKATYWLRFAKRTVRE
jgi:hypothetical protein